MKKVALALLAAVLIASPAVAAKKKVAAEPKDPNEASWHLVRDSLPLFLPSWALPIYFATHDKNKEQKKM